MKSNPEPSTQEVLAGLVERVTFRNADNGSCVIRARARGHRDLVGAEVVEQRLVEHRALSVRSGNAYKDDRFITYRAGNGFRLRNVVQIFRQRASRPVPGGHIVSRPSQVPRHASIHCGETDEGDTAYFDPSSRKFEPQQRRLEAPPFPPPHPPASAVNTRTTKPQPGSTLHSVRSPSQLARPMRLRSGVTRT